MSAAQLHPLSPGRLLSLDVFRGATIAAMILVNNAGDWSQTFAPLLHAPWHGWTVTDLIFPFFLFIVGVAIPYAFGKRLESGGSPQEIRALHGKILRRALTLFGLGLFLNFFRLGPIPWDSVRIPGVLQRIAVVYALAALAYLHLRPRGRAILAVALLVGYWLVMLLVPVPSLDGGGWVRGDLGPDHNLAAWLDARLLGAHTWVYAPGPGDPEGLLSTFPALVTALAGLFTGDWLRSRRSAREKLIGLFVWGNVLLAAGLALTPLFPINKNLWTSTYVLFTAGFALVVLAICFYLLDLSGQQSDVEGESGEVRSKEERRPPRWALPFLVFGANSIAAFVGSSFVAKLLYLIRVTGPEGKEITLQRWLYAHLIEPLFPPYWASLTWALATLLLWLGLMAVLYRRRIFIKV